jgi:hypothetical protein
MKTILTTAIAVMSFSLSSFAADPLTSIYYDGATTGNQQPGYATEFIDFYSGNYAFGGPSVNHNALGNGTITSDLNSFTIQGGVGGTNSGGNNFSVITTPASQSFLTGGILAGPGIAFALSPGVYVDGSLVLNPSFDYNDFYVYLMISNTNGTYDDSQVSIDPRNTFQNPAFGTGDITPSPADNQNEVAGSSPSTAEYLTFHIIGLGATIAADPGADLVVSANLPAPDGKDGYIGGLSISVPEPSTYALMLGGLALLGFCVRRRLA